MKQKILERIIECCTEIRCDRCGGYGHYQDHDREDIRREHYEDGDCRTCPQLYQCEVCRSKGTIVELQLQHLLRTIEQSIKTKHESSSVPIETLGNFTEHLWAVTKKVLMNYDLTKSLEENLDTNRELVEFLGKILL